MKDADKKAAGKPDKPKDKEAPVPAHIALGVSTDGLGALGDGLGGGPRYDFAPQFAGVGLAVAPPSGQGQYDAHSVDGDSGEDDEDRAFHYTAALHGGDPEGLDRLRGATAGASVPAAATIRSPLFTQPRETRWYVVQGGPHEGVYSITAARSMIVSTYNREIAPLYEHFAGASVARCASETEAESTLRGIQAASLFLCVCLCMMPCFWA